MFGTICNILQYPISFFNYAGESVNVSQFKGSHRTTGGTSSNLSYSTKQADNYSFMFYATDVRATDYASENEFCWFTSGHWAQKDITLLQIELLRLLLCIGVRLLISGHSGRQSNVGRPVSFLITSCMTFLWYLTHKMRLGHDRRSNRPSRYSIEVPMSLLHTRRVMAATPSGVWTPKWTLRAAMLYY